MGAPAWLSQISFSVLSHHIHSAIIASSPIILKEETRLSLCSIANMYIDLITNERV